MKIIKMGNMSNYKNICPYCGCEYEYDNNDIFTGYNLTSSYRYVICPCCHKENTISYSYYSPIINSPMCSEFEELLIKEINSDNFNNHIPIIECQDERCDDINGDD